MPGAVFDCMVFVQALANARGPARACYELVRSGELALFLSPDVLAEVRDVLNRPKLRRKLPALTPDAVEAFLQDVEGQAVMIADIPRVFTLERDPKDEPYLNLATATGARYLISRDRDLLDLMNDEGFRSSAPGLLILDPPALLREPFPSVPVEDRGRDGTDIAPDPSGE